MLFMCVHLVPSFLRYNLPNSAILCSAISDMQTDQELHVVNCNASSALLNAVKEDLHACILHASLHQMYITESLQAGETISTEQPKC